MRNLFIVVCALFAINAYSQSFINELDQEHVVQLDIYPNKACVTFDNKIFNLDANTLYLDGELSDEQAASSPYIYNNVREALSNIDSSSSEKMTLLIAPGVYWVDDPDDPTERITPNGTTPYGMRVDCKELSMIGLTNNPINVVLACNRGNTQGASGNFTMLRFNSDAIDVRNITFGNYCNVDLEFPLKPTYNRKMRSAASTQAQLIITVADKVFAHNCRFISRQSLSPFNGARRALFDECHLECATNSLNSSAIYHKCHFLFFSSSPVAESATYSDIIFLDCDIISNTMGTQYFCRNHGAVLIDTRLTTLRDHNLKLAFNSYPSNDTWYYSNVSVNGQKQAIDGGIDISDLPIMDAFKINDNGKVVYNIANLVAGDDKWDPLAQRESIGDEHLGIPVIMQINSPEEGILLGAANDIISYTATFYRWGGYEANSDEIDKISKDEIKWNSPNVASFMPISRFVANLETHNTMREPINGWVSASVSSGLMAKSPISVAPYFYKAPTFLKRPTISLDVEGKRLVLDYILSDDPPRTDNPTDCSLISWYRYTKDDKSDAIPIIICDAECENAKFYPLKKADMNAKILAVVSARHSLSYIGRTVECTYSEPYDPALSSKLFTDETHYFTDFHEVSVDYHPRHLPGVWNFDAYKPADTKDYNWTPIQSGAWFYGKGEGGMIGEGIVQRNKGARCSYIPCRDKSSDMRARVIIDPGKTSGQGFGSATGQYLDICIKFDMNTLTGYALRIERIPDFSKAANFKLIEYVNGETKTIGESVVSNCFVSTCTIIIELKGNRLTATASTNNTTMINNDSRVLRSVYLSAKVDKSTNSSFCIQHTGSTGASAAMIHSVELDWK